jgi:hypothetical protein
MDSTFHGISRRSEKHRLSIQLDFSFIRRVGTGQDLDQSRFACSVVTKERNYFTLVNIEVHSIKRTNSAKVLGDIVHRQQGTFRLLHSGHLEKFDSVRIFQLQFQA